VKNNKSYRLILIFLLTVLSLNVYAQNAQLFLIENEKTTHTYEVKDTLSVLNKVNEKISSYLDKGYIEASLDSITLVKGSYHAYIHKGKVYKWAEIKMSSDNLPISLKQIIDLENKKIKLSRFVNLRKQLLRKANNLGYAFSFFALSEIKINKNKIKATAILHLGTKVIFDRLKLKGEDVMSLRFLSKYLSIKEKGVFSKTVIDNIPYMIEQLPGVKLNEAPRLEFYKNICRVVLSLKKLANDQLEGLLGFQSQLGSQKLQLVGNANIKLSNLFHSGKGLNLSWDKFSNQGQHLDLGMFYPRLLGSSFDASANLSLFKRDSLYLIAQYGGNVSVQHHKHRYSVGLQSIRSSLITNQSIDSIRNYTSINSYISYEYRTIPLSALALRGSLININFGLNNTKLKDTTLSYPAVTIRAKALKIIPLFDWLFLSQKFEYFTFISEQILINQLENIGGYGSIRGFNQNEFYTKNYLIGSSSLMIKTGDDARFSVFSDYGKLGLLESNIDLVSVGLGFDMKAKNTLFRFAYAIGKTSTQDFSLLLSKVHVGIATEF